jgi:hypothetical protein
MLTIELRDIEMLVQERNAATDLSQPEQEFLGKVSEILYQTTVSHPAFKIRNSNPTNFRTDLKSRRMMRMGKSKERLKRRLSDLSESCYDRAFQNEKGLGFSRLRCSR